METPPYSSLSIQSSAPRGVEDKGLKIGLAVAATAVVVLAVALVAVLLTPAVTVIAQPPAQPMRTQFNILQVNDVYEMETGTDGLGGLSRVASLRQELEAHTPLTLLALAGDVLSPSALSIAKVFSADAGRGGEELRGAQMVDVFNTMQLDFAVLGNHEYAHTHNNNKQQQQTTHNNNTQQHNNNTQQHTTTHTPPSPFSPPFVADSI